MALSFRRDWENLDLRDGVIYGISAQFGKAEERVAISHERFMREALIEARRAAAMGEVPVGAVLARDGQIIGRGHNRRELDGDPLAHAEIFAIREGARRVGDWRLEESTLYVTLEPCPMCAGAIVLARIPFLVFGTRDPKAGGAGSVMNLLQNERLNHQVQIVEGILEEECSRILKDFFQDLRTRAKEVKTP